MSLLTTKLYIPPLRPELVSRPRLIDQLNAAMRRKLTLISAPAGYGKTTLLSEWIYQNRDGLTPPLPVAWLSLDKADNDPIRFLSYLIGGAQTIVPQVGRDLLGALRSPEPPPTETTLVSLINELTSIPQNCNQCCLLGIVLDDYHVIESQEIHHAVAFLLDRLPPPPEGMHLVIATRKDPLLPLPRWRAGAHMTDMREAHLRFTHKEATVFLTQSMGLDLSADDVAILEARTEGWIAGLQLAALSMQGLDATQTTSFISAFSGDDRHIVDYLIDEVLGQRPRGTKDFLLQTSILQRMSGPLCDAVTGGDEGQKVLEMLEQANLFVVPLDNQRRWYRYHHMFADLLRHRLQATVGTARQTSLHLRASEWYESNGYVSDAVNHAFAAGNSAKAASLIEQNARDMFARSELRTIMNWVDALPEELVHARPWLCVFYAWALRLTGGQAEAVEARLQVAELSLENTKTVLPKNEVRTVEGHMAAIRAYQALYREEILQVIDLARQALGSLPEATFARGLTALALGWAYRFNGDLAGASQAFVEARAASMASGNTYVAVTATCRLAYTEILGGQLRKAVRSCREALQMATGAEGRYLPVAGYALVYMGNVYREWDNPEVAARHLVDGIELCKQVGYIMDQVVGYTTLARVLQAKHDWDGARKALQRAERLSLKMKGYVYARRWVEDCQVRLWSAHAGGEAKQIRVSELARWIQETDLRVGDELGFARELEHIILARALVALGRERAGEPHLDMALDLLTRLRKIAETAGWMGKSIEILVLQALAHQGHGDTDKALNALERALSFAEPEGYVRTFVDEGPPMKRLLRALSGLQTAVSQLYLDRLLAAFAEATKADDSSIAPGPPSALVEPLSKRELEVLRLVGEGLSNREIAQRLFVAPNTVKVHTRNIYGKLGVHNRTEATARARELGLL
jgi:LuxR family maltose regulon positive regulatory protein